MEIRHLITFRTIVDMGSYTNAANKLGYTQSTITSHIQALEKEIGGKLFSYVKRDLNLTSLGKEVIPLADELLETYNRISVLNKENKISGELKIAAPESLTVSRLGRVLREYTTHFPNVRIILTNGTCGENHRDVTSGYVDVAFMLWPELKANGCVHHQLHKEEIVLITSPYKKQHFNDIIERASENFFIANEAGCSYRRMFENHLIANKGPKFQTMELWSIEAIKQSVMSGLGFSVLPYMTVKKEVENGQLSLIEHNETFEPIYSHMLVKSKKWQSPAVEKFIEIALTNI
ncbi:hypothetical protein CN918_30070 [Priestia megaterium]|nr:hypothetical protein CN918_30070 [Priestia megaterium]